MWLIILLRLGYLVMVCPLTFSSKNFQCILSIVVDTACFIQEYDMTHSTNLDFQQASTFNIISSYDMILRVDSEYHAFHIIVKSSLNGIQYFQTTDYSSPCNSMIAWGAYRERTFQSSGEIHNQLSFRFRPGLVLFSYYCLYAAFNVIIFFVISSIFILGEFFFFECQWDMYERMSITEPVFSLNVIYRMCNSFYLFVVMCFQLKLWTIQGWLW